MHKWVKRADPNLKKLIDTLPSRPRSHPRTLSAVVIKRIVELRTELRRSAPVIYEHLQKEGVVVSLSSVGRTLKRLKLTKKRKQASYYVPIKRPEVTKPGDLVQIDTIHFLKPGGGRFYIYAVIDLYSRYARAYYSPKIRQIDSLRVVRLVERDFRFKLRTVQADNGPEFRDQFATNLAHRYIQVRHARVRTPNDNAHVERFIRTLQEEALGSKIPSIRGLQQRLDTYLEYYNNQRLHFGLKLKTPTEIVSKVMN